MVHNVLTHRPKLLLWNRVRVIVVMLLISLAYAGDLRPYCCPRSIFRCLLLDLRFISITKGLEVG